MNTDDNEHENALSLREIEEMECDELECEFGLAAPLARKQWKLHEHQGVLHHPLPTAFWVKQ
jgi:hypothetical protein